ncbi:PB1 domain, RWP-RK domain, Homeodomain-like protein [Artemisia annua]|uniref:PB1 domain, RWP-RK domain, Homeodomain-like protein n=1 Tax=Artemisia annua TaxID=35608 RepID=A0A2U1N9E1_ARTAN|nr:PB1 domain, RWP-RK domain, Homeodomain-like protein [Artemisia annua]
MPDLADFYPINRPLTGVQEAEVCSVSMALSFKLRANVDPHNQNIQDKMIAVMKLLSFRKQHVIVQFWSPHVVGKHRSLTNIGQPFGVGVIGEKLLLYRKNSKRNVHVVDDESGEEDLDPIARVFTRGLPEWTCDVTNYLPKYFPQQASAICCDLRGYLALPVFDSTTCVGVIEILTSLEYLEFAYEVQQVYNALKKQNLTCTRVFDGPAANVPEEWNKVFGILKSVCDIHGLPLAQTWAVSPFTTFVSHDAAIKKSCSSFDTKCIGNTCMSTVWLPFYVRDRDMNLWPFRKACRKRHLDSSRGLVGRALSHGSCFCENVTKLGKEEYPLVPNAHMSGLTSCLAILLHSVESQADYVLEFFLPSEVEDVSYVVQTLKQITGLDSGFLLGDTSSMDFPDISDSESTVVDGSHKGSANETIKKSCSSFDTKCIGNTCMSTVWLPFYVRDRDMNLWPFRKACRKRHLDSSRGLVGRALSHGSCFCENVTKLGKEEYPLVPNAHMSGLTSCLAILLHSVESQADYVLEFFLPSEVEDVSYVVQTLKQITGLDSGFLLGDTSSMDFPDISDSESTVVDGSHKGSANESKGKIRAVTFTDDEEASSPLKKLKNIL